MDVGPHRDLVGELANAIRANSTLKFGLYHSLFEWFNPMCLSDRRSGFQDKLFVHNKVSAQTEMQCGCIQLSEMAIVLYEFPAVDISNELFCGIYPTASVFSMRKLASDLEAKVLFYFYLVIIRNGFFR